MLYDAVLSVVGGTPTDEQSKWLYITACVLLVVGCWAIVKIADWIFHV